MLGKLPKIWCRIFVVSLVSKNIKIKTYIKTSLLFVLYTCETWFLILREERRLREFENRVQRRIFVLRGIRWQVNGGNHIMRSLIICTAHQILFRWSKREERDGRGRGRKGAYRVLVGKPRGKRPLGRPKRRWEDNSKKVGLGRGAVFGLAWSGSE